MTSVMTSYVLPEDVVTYCEQHDLLGHVETALRLAEEYFQPIERLEVEVQPDPEVESLDSVIIDIWVKMSVEEAIKRDALFTRSWVTSVPPVAVAEIILVYHPI